jgi:hypothetical protein
LLLARARDFSSTAFTVKVRKWRRGRSQLLVLISHSRASNSYSNTRLAQRRTARDVYAGTFHRFISYGFVILTIATTVVALDADFGTAIMRGHFYLYFQSLIVDLFGALVLAGVGLAA